jgi:hypothetical protein
MEKGAIAHKTEQARVKIWSSPRRYDWVQYLDAVRACYQADGSWKQIPYRYYLQSHFACCPSLARRVIHRICRSNGLTGWSTGVRSEGPRLR